METVHSFCLPLFIFNFSQSLSSNFTFQGMQTVRRFPVVRFIIRRMSYCFSIVRTVCPIHLYESGHFVLLPSKPSNNTAVMNIFCVGGRECTSSSLLTVRKQSFILKIHLNKCDPLCQCT